MECSRTSLPIDEPAMADRLLTMDYIFLFFSNATQDGHGDPAGSRHPRGFRSAPTGGRAGGSWLLLARKVQGIGDARRLTAYGTLYKALTRLEGEGYLASHGTYRLPRQLKRAPVGSSIA